MNSIGIYIRWGSTACDKSHTGATIISFPAWTFCASMLKYSDTVSIPSVMAELMLTWGQVGAAAMLEAPRAAASNIETCILMCLCVFVCV